MNEPNCIKKKISQYKNVNVGLMFLLRSHILIVVFLISVSFIFGIDWPYSFRLSFPLFPFFELDFWYIVLVIGLFIGIFFFAEAGYFFWLFCFLFFFAWFLAFLLASVPEESFSFLGFLLRKRYNEELLLNHYSELIQQSNLLKVLLGHLTEADLREIVEKAEGSEEKLVELLMEEARVTYKDLVIYTLILTFSLYLLSKLS